MSWLVLLTIKLNGDFGKRGIIRMIDGGFYN